MRSVLPGLVSAVLVVAAAGCSAPIQRLQAPGAPRPSGLADQTVAPVGATGRPRVGVAFGGGSARGIAHIGVIRWLEEHRIPIDVAAGTSMGGLMGGAFATGMDAAELEAFVQGIDWDAIFDSSDFAYKNIRRKADNRSFPSRLEFGMKRGLVAPTSLNNGEGVELLIEGVTAPYYDISSFDELPTPFRTVAVDLVGAEQVVLDRGSLATALRATMSLPLIFPPVQVDGRVLVDGGAMNNVPADVVRGMGADRVIAVNVGQLENPEGVSYTLLGVAGATLDAMMRASTSQSIEAADVRVDVPLKDFSSLDWRRSPELIEAGYAAAEAVRDQLLPYAVSEDEFARWKADRASRRRRTLPTPAFVTVEGFAASDASRLHVLTAAFEGAPIDQAELEEHIAQLMGLNRYETITWRLQKNDAGQTGLVITAHPKTYAPPFMMLGLNLENTSSTDFRLEVSGRYLNYGLLTSGSELRVDGTVGSFPAAGAEFYQPIGASPLFIAPYASVANDSASSLTRDVVVAKYAITSSRIGLNVGINLGAFSDIRVGAYKGYMDASVDIGDPNLPELKGDESGIEAVWLIDTQDSPVVPSRGLLARTRFLHLLDGPDAVVNGERVPFDMKLNQLSFNASRFWSLGEKNRLFATGGIGTSFDETAIGPYTFALGTPMRMGAYRKGELRGSHYYVATGGYMRQMGRLPDFLGGPVFVGGWMENGDAFGDWQDAEWRTNTGFGVIMDTLVGPVMVGGSAGFDKRWRTYVGVGRLFR